MVMRGIDKEHLEKRPTESYPSCIGKPTGRHRGVCELGTDCRPWTLYFNNGNDFVYLKKGGHAVSDLNFLSRRDKTTMIHIFALTTISILMNRINEGNAISCYTCNSRNGTDQNCHDPFHPAMSTYTEACKVPKEGHIGQFPANFCIKVIGKTIQTEVEHVIRACVLENMDNQCGVFRFEEDTLQGCILTCDYDGCNGDSQLQGGALLLIASILLKLLVRTFNRI
ncbi:hypothetical protein JTE90_010516 [Oedothorax gibbosus]|uniref:Protein sleepless n=1 Tax=Oedothorax gibbosus TaxID=931172 RepID=A0AAV6W0B7_9ARAC|nr:hypothetical protein JTE90_010516 [Oedothorax gibbosus]